MLPLYQELGFMFRFAQARIIPRFHLEGVASGRRVVVYRINLVTSQQLSLLAMAAVGEVGWVDLPKPIIVRAGD